MSNPETREAAAHVGRWNQRLAELKQEYRAGGEQLRALEARQRDLQGTLLRISGAIQVLEEMVREAGVSPAS